MYVCEVPLQYLCGLASDTVVDGGIGRLQSQGGRVNIIGARSLWNSRSMLESIGDGRFLNRLTAYRLTQNMYVSICGYTMYVCMYARMYRSSAVDCVGNVYIFVFIRRRV